MAEETTMEVLQKLITYDATVALQIKTTEKWKTHYKKVSSDLTKMEEVLGGLITSLRKKITPSKKQEKKTSSSSKELSEAGLASKKEEARITDLIERAVPNEKVKMKYRPRVRSLIRKGKSDEYIIDAIQKASQKKREPVEPKKKGFFSKIGGFFSKAKGVFSWIGEMFFKFVIQPLIKIFHYLENLVVALWKAITNLPELITNLVNLIGNLNTFFDKMKGWIASAEKWFTGWKEKNKPFLEDLSTWFNNIGSWWETTKATIETAKTTFFNVSFVLLMLLLYLVKFIDYMFQEIPKTINAILQKVDKVLAPLSLLLQTFLSFINGIIKNISEFKNNPKNQLLWNEVKSFSAKMRGSVTEGDSQIWIKQIQRVFKNLDDLMKLQEDPEAAISERLEERKREQQERTNNRPKPSNIFSPILHNPATMVPPELQKNSSNLTPMIDKVYVTVHSDGESGQLVGYDIVQGMKNALTMVDLKIGGVPA